MRYIEKVSIPQFFIDDTKKLSSWDKYYSTKKRALKAYILKEEQNSLCCYCEDRIDINNSHIEHIKPKSLDKENLTFDYYNLSISCNGTCRNSEDDKTRYNCGHRKDKDDTQYNEDKFLNPLKVEDIREYFKYNRDAEIIISNKDRNKAQYMIDTLHLNDGDLPKAREDALKDFEEIDFDSIEELQFILAQEDIAFISFLKYKYRNLI
ncbi:hypothetical protein MNB_SV-9-329 [hydrothermal vent metagenome]|uniref:TIGR02646 family protein n=1 Tax=hydrothermal vent metagenome TaxID=652676 RepID=A0A1W1BC77_9ZZZZ